MGLCGGELDHGTDFEGRIWTHFPAQLSNSNNSNNSVPKIVPLCISSQHLAVHSVHEQPQNIQGLVKSKASCCVGLLFWSL